MKLADDCHLPTTLKVEDLCVDYPMGRTVHSVLGHISFSARAGEIICIVGPSGVGKSTLLRCLAGLQTPSTGAVEILPVDSAGVGSAGVVFQDYAQSLLPWASVLQNVGLPLRGKVSRLERDARARSAIEEVGLARFESHRPWELSGGMQQRVAIARALVFEPTILLMDEPFASVDAQTRADLEDLTLGVRNDTHKTVVVITHDIDEAVYLADTVFVLRGEPASIVETIDVPLGRERDQGVTKSDPAFVALRTRVHDLITGRALSAAEHAQGGQAS
jgi:NitT/TauT family transport system ATP-binding protein